MTSCNPAQKMEKTFTLSKLCIVFVKQVFTIALIALVCVVTANPAHSEGYDKQLESVAQTLAGEINKAGKKSVATVDFTDLQGNITELGRFVAEELSTDLVLIDKQFSVIDRVHLRSILAEQKLSVSGLLNPKNAKKLGQIAGVDALIIGSITPFGENIRITFKVIATDTAHVIAAARTSIAKTGAVEELLVREIAEGSPAAVPGQASASIHPSNRRFGQVAPFQNSFLRVSLLSAALSQDKKKVSITLNFTNITKKNIYIAVKSGSSETIMIDNLGNEWRVDNLVGLQFYNNTLLTQGQNTTVIMTFNPVHESITPGNIFNFSSNMDAKDFGNFSVGLIGIHIK